MKWVIDRELTDKERLIITIVAKAMSVPINFSEDMIHKVGRVGLSDGGILWGYIGDETYAPWMSTISHPIISFEEALKRLKCGG